MTFIAPVRVMVTAMVTVTATDMAMGMATDTVTTIKRTEITKGSKLFKFMKFVIFSRTNKINKNNFIDRLNLFRELDDKFKLTKYGKTDRFNSFYKLILLHRYINRYDRLKRYSKVLKKAKFRRKYENTLNLRFCYA